MTLDEATGHYVRGEYAQAAAAAELVLLDDPDADTRLSAACLLLTATEPWWGLAGAPTGAFTVPQLLEQADAAAAAIGSASAQAAVERVRAHYVLHTQGLQAGLIALRESVRLARSGDDRVVELFALADLGHIGVGADFELGRTVLAEALSLAEGLRDSAEPLTRLAIARLAGFAGVACFDAGEFDPGEELLSESLSELDAIGARDSWASIANYYGQLLIATGRFEEASSLLERAVGSLPDFPDASSYRAYNIALRGKLLLEWGRMDEADGPLHSAWAEVSDSGHAGLRTIIANYLAELLLHKDFGGRDAAAAGRLVGANIEDCRRNAYRRSECNAHALQALTLLELGTAGEALAASVRAIDIIERAGTLPALREEEIFLIHSQVLLANGRNEESQSWLERARGVVERKASSIAEVHRRLQFRERVAVNVRIGP